MEPTRIEVAGTFNFRDIGGWVTPAGQVAPGQVFRSDGLAALTEESRETLRGLGICTVIDLREDRERRHAPDALGDLEVTQIHAPIFGNRLYPADRERADRLAVEKPGLEELYALVIEHFGANVANVIDTVAGAVGPVVYHCSAGKDRTGIVTAFIHEILGVARHDVVSDYNATERFLGQEFRDAITAHFASAGILADLTHSATRAPREYMENLLARVDEEYGGVEQYLIGVGLDPTTPELLRAKLVVD